MMDVIMVGTLIVCIVSILFFTVFCSKQVDKKSPVKKEEQRMLVLGIIIVAMFGYLTYALINPEKF